MMNFLQGFGHGQGEKEGWHGCHWVQDVSAPPALALRLPANSRCGGSAAGDAVGEVLFDFLVKCVRFLFEFERVKIGNKQTTCTITP